jgi:hypothetical protein
LPIKRIDHRHDRPELEVARQRRVGEQGLRHRAGIGQTAGLDDHAVEAGDLAAASAHRGADQRLLQVAAQVAAQAAVRQRNCFFRRPFDQEMIDGHLAKFVHDDERIGLFLQQLVDQRRLAAAEKAGDHHDRGTAVGNQIFISRA